LDRPNAVLKLRPRFCSAAFRFLVKYANVLADLAVAKIPNSSEGRVTSRYRLILVVIVLTFQGIVASQETPSAQPAKSLSLPTGKTLTVPSPGRIGSTNSFPTTITMSPDGRFAALLNDGYGTQETQATQSIAVLDLKTNLIADFPDKRFGEEAHQSYFLGLVFGSDGKHLYASVGSISDATGEKPGDTGNGIAVYSFTNGKVVPERFITIAPQTLAAGKKVSVELQKTPAGTAIPYPAGLALISASGQPDRLLVADNLSDNVVLLDVESGKSLLRFDLSISDLVPSAFPYTVVASKDGRRAWCSVWNASRVAELDLTSGSVTRWIKLKEPEDPIAPGSHPTAMLLSPDEKLLYVALSNVDAVAVVRTDAGAASIFLSTAAEDQKASGSYPTALAQSSDGSRLFVADSSLNAVGVLDVSRVVSGPVPVVSTIQPLGFIPTDWYPSALVVHGDDLLIATAKGEGAGPNKAAGGQWGTRHREHAYIPTLIRGSIARLNIPSTLGKLDELTRAVDHDNLLHDDPATVQFAAGHNPIKHVIYVIKENRTYDQVLGDLKLGNGDPSLTMYGADTTPNEHKLALQFGVLDNFYDSGEVSGDGHLWSTAAITSDYNEKTWQIAYRGRERTYDFQGTVAGEYPLDHKHSDIDDPGTGFLWDNVAHHGLTYRDYGEYVNAEWCNKVRKAASPKEGTPSAEEASCPRTEIHKGDPLEPNVGDPHAGSSPWTWPVPVFKGVKPTKALLRDHFDPLYPDFNTDYPDQLRVDEFMNEFAAYVRARNANEGREFELPAFVLLYLPDDHTGGTRPEKPRPAASVADNDLALGRVVEAVSNSSYWDDTAIFVLEDDAQDGGDHVDAHRSIAFVASKYSPGTAFEPYIEHRFYTTVNMIHTMEVLLGLPPMNQNDAYAPAMAPLFSGKGDQPAFKADYRNLRNGLIYETNKRDARGASESAKMDFSRPDAAGTKRLNRVLWRDEKGDAPVPAPKHSVFPATED
jgi:DNA-binding beta-propeller fold protein YncE